MTIKRTLALAAAQIAIMSAAEHNIIEREAKPEKPRRLTKAEKKQAKRNRHVET